MRFRKRPIVIHAVQFTGDNAEAIAMALRAPPGVCMMSERDSQDPLFTIKTLEGHMAVSVDDWVIRGVKGELYPCKPDVFTATYEAAD